MYYLKVLFFNFLTVFFANHILPGVDALDQTKLPHIGGDLIFSISLGFLNSLIFPTLKVFNTRITPLKIGVIALVLNLIAYAMIKVIPLGILIESIEGYILASVVVTIGSFLTNFLEMKHSQHHHHEQIVTPEVEIYQPPADKDDLTL